MAWLCAGVFFVRKRTRSTCHIQMIKIGKVIEFDVFCIQGPLLYCSFVLTLDLNLIVNLSAAGVSLFFADHKLLTKTLTVNERR